ncbi:unnamed protein product [Rotaria sp. Silwood2]|nr:unnamed protein product [Rotaria sp. Silwood2]
MQHIKPLEPILVDDDVSLPANSTYNTLQTVELVSPRTNNESFNTNKLAQNTNATSSTRIGSNGLICCISSNSCSILPVVFSSHVVLEADVKLIEEMLDIVADCDVDEILNDELSDEVHDE